MIEIKNLSKEYGSGKNKKDIFKNLNLVFEDNKINLIYGRSGEGKTTLLSILARITKPTSGKIILDKIEIQKISKKLFLNKKISYLEQKPFLFPSLNVSQNIALPLLLQGEKKEKIYKKVDQLLRSIQLSDLAKNTANNLSGGQEQRVALLRALIGGAKTILIDEPTSNLDPKTSQEIIKLICNLQKKHKLTIIIVSHDPLLIKKADILYELRSGKIKKLNK